MAVALGLREMKKERTRADIIRVATKLFKRRGFDAVTVEEIAAAAEVSHRTFYRYFATKEELVLGASRDKVDSFSRLFEARPVTEPVTTSLRRAIMEMADAYEQEFGHDRDRIALIRATPSLRQAQEDRHAAMEGVMVPLIAQRLGVDPLDDLRPALIAGCSMASIRVATSQWLAGDPTRPLLPMVEQALEMSTKAFDKVR